MRLSEPVTAALTIVLALLVVLVAAQRARGDDLATSASVLLATEGEAVARQWCAGCHAIGADARDTAISDAPSFKLLAEEPYLDGDMLLALRTSPHPFMPEFPLTQRSADALAAFIRSRRSAEPYDPYQLWESDR